MKISRMIAAGKMLAITIIVLGVIHDFATFTPLINGGLECLSPADKNAMIYMSLICGTSFILSGLLLVLLLRKVMRYAFLTTPIAVIGIFLALSAIVSIIYMFDNPFAWIALLLNLSTLIITIGLKIRLNDEKGV